MLVSEDRRYGCAESHVCEGSGGEHYGRSRSVGCLHGEEKRREWQRLRGWLSTREGSVPKGEYWRSGITALDERYGKGLPRGTYCEIVCPRLSCGGQTLLHHLLNRARASCHYTALIDLHATFDPGSAATGALQHLLWVRCPDSKLALRAADIILRDENFRIVILDLRTPVRTEGRNYIAPTAWYRLQRVLEQTRTVVFQFVTRPTASAVHCRWSVNAPLMLRQLNDMPRSPQLFREALTRLF